MDIFTGLFNGFVIALSGTNMLFCSSGVQSARPSASFPAWARSHDRPSELLDDLHHRLPGDRDSS